MLVLSRRVGESIVVGDDIVVTVLEVRGDVVRVGVDAPRSVQVRRQELLDELAQTNRAAASPRSAAVNGLSQLAARRHDQPARPAAPSDPPPAQAPADGSDRGGEPGVRQP